MKKIIGCAGCVGGGIGLMVIVGIIGAVIETTKTGQSTGSDSVDRDQSASSPSEPDGADEPKPSSNGGGGSRAEAIPSVTVDSAAIRSKRETVIGKTFAALTVGERQYSNATVTGIDDFGINLTHAAGMASIHWDQVSVDVQDQWGYNPGAFAIAVAAEKEAKKKAEKEAEKGQREAKQVEIDKEFMATSLNARWVVYIEKADSGGHDFHVRLPAGKYTTKENVKQIAEFIARAFVVQSQNKGGYATSATVHVWERDKVMVRGSYWK